LERAVYGDHGHLTVDQIGGQSRQFALSIREAEFDRHVPALDVTGFLEALTERSRFAVVRYVRSRVVEEPDDRHRRLLRTRRERPCCRRAAKQRYEVAPVVIELHAIPHDERGPHRRISNCRRSVSG
jgi:hypothetical protein